MALARVALHGSWLRVVIAPWGVAREQWLIQAEASTSDNVTRHPLTGAFANPLHESAFRAQLFRSAYVCHALLMTLSLAVYIWVALIAPQNLRVFWATIALITTFFTIGRALLHHMEDTQRGQQVSSWAWTGFLVPASIAVIYVYVMDTDSACEHVQLTYFAPLTSFATALINGSHGLGFVHKLCLIGLLLVTDLVPVTVCGELALALALCNWGALVVGSAAAHMVEVYLRHSYAEKVQDKRRVREEKSRLEERNEQLRTSNERLLYDMKLRARSFDEDDLSAIGRGLQAEASQPHQPAGDADSSEAGGPAPSSAPPPSLPPGAPSSTTSESAAPPRLTETDDDGAQRAQPDRAGGCHSRAPLPAEWNEAKAPDGRTYYFHTVTKETKWTRPAAAAAASAEPPLPAGWKQAEAPNGRTYYHYLPGGKGTQWVRPTELADAAAATPAAAPGEEVALSQFEMEAEEEAMLVDLMADEELQSILGSSTDSLSPRQQAVDACLCVVDQPAAAPTVGAGAPADVSVLSGARAMSAEALSLGHVVVRGGTLTLDRPPCPQSPTMCPLHVQAHSITVGSGGVLRLPQAAMGLAPHYALTSAAALLKVAGAFNVEAGGRVEVQSILGSKDSLTPRQQALRVARQDMHMQIRPNNIERFRILHTLSVALGASRTEASTIKALHAVLLQLERPGTSDKEACAATGASHSNYYKWRRLVQHAQLDLPAP